MGERPSRVALIGAGNPLMGDDGFGLAVLERLRDDWSITPGVELVDGGTWGMNLLPVLEDADAVIFIDAINAGLAPGSPVLLEREQLPVFLATKISPHEIGLRDVITLAEVRGRLPRKTVAIGVQPASVAVGWGLTPVVESRIGPVTQMVLERLRAWGFTCEPVMADA